MTTTPILSEYDIHAQNFLDIFNLSIALEFQGFRKYFPDDTEKRNVYEFTIKNNATKKEYVGTFGDSIHNSTLPPSTLRVPNPKRKDPTAYDILSCLDICDELFPDFCDNFGYDSDSITARNIYDSVINQSIGLRKVLTPEAIEALQEIQ